MMGQGAGSDQGHVEVRIAAVLAARSGPEAEALRKDLKAVGDAGLKELLTLAANCPDLASFREQVILRRPKRKR